MIGSIVLLNHVKHATLPLDMYVLDNKVVYQIAAAGFNKDQISVTQKNDSIIVEFKPSDVPDDGRVYIRQRLLLKPMTLTIPKGHEFKYYTVEGKPSFENGLLTITLVNTDVAKPLEIA